MSVLIPRRIDGSGLIRAYSPQSSHLGLGGLRSIASTAAYAMARRSQKPD